MTTPTLKALRRRYPRSVIHYAVGSHARPAIIGHPDVAELVDVGAGAGRGVRSALALLRRMRRGRYDMCLVLERSPLFTVLPLLAGIAVRAGIDSAGRGFALNVRVPWDESLHEADLYLSVAAAVGCATDNLQLHFEPDAAASQAAEDVFQLHGIGGRVVAIAPGGGTNPGMDLPEKRWPPERFAALADRLVREEGVTVAVIGGPSDRSACAAMRDAMKSPFVDLTGDTPFAERAAFLERCALFVGNDSGPMHLAVATGCPVVAIFGPTDPGLYGPYHARAIVVRHALPCSPCFVHGHYPPCPNNHACMERLRVDDVYEACHELLSGAR
jgi:lipopolysaccharide heptosyltransferase II